MKSKRIKRPHIPRCLCRDWVNYMLQIPSPSLIHSYRKGRNKEADEYFKQHEEFLKQISERTKK